MNEKPMMGCGHVANGRVEVNGEWVPCCVICSGIHPGAATPVGGPDLTGRHSHCTCGVTVPSSLSLPFFEFRGEGSRVALESCGTCGYNLVAHTDEVRSRNPKVCKDFVPRGAMDQDTHYCGHAGWD